SIGAGSCSAGSCTSDGTPIAPFTPRTTPEPVSWQPNDGNGDDMIKSGAGNNTLIRTKPTALDPVFDVGAYSDQIIEAGDGYVEFTATELGQARVCGLSKGDTDDDNSDLDIDFGIRLAAGGNILISESGTWVVPPNGDDVTYSFGDYQSN